VVEVEQEVQIQLVVVELVAIVLLFQEEQKLH
jgi:hypothetical protein